MTENNETTVDKTLRRLKDNRYVAPVVIFGIVIIAVAHFSGALAKIGEIFISNPSSYLNEYKEIESLFNKIHSAYINDFEAYLDHFAKEGDSRHIIRQLTEKNRLTFHDRAKLVRLVKDYVVKTEKIKNTALLMNHDLYRLVMDYFGYSDSDFVHSEFDTAKIAYQRWRKSIKNNIEFILSEDWQSYCDRGGIKRLMTESEKENWVYETWERLKEPGDREFNIDVFKKYLIRDSIIRTINECQWLADKINGILIAKKPNN